MTQELIANMLGVRREGVTEAAGKLQQAGLIKYSRGHILVADRAALEARVRVLRGRQAGIRSLAARPHRLLIDKDENKKAAGRLQPIPPSGQSHCADSRQCNENADE